MLSGSAPAGLSFLSKAARHSSGFTKSSEDETNPVASLCESCHETPHLTTIPPPTRPLSLSLFRDRDFSGVGGEGVGGTTGRKSVCCLSF